MTQKKADIAIQVRRDHDGKVYSQVIDLSLDPHDKRVIDREMVVRVVIDRQKGAGMDSDTVISRAKAVATCLRVNYDEDLHWPCKAVEGYRDCQCPRCVKIADERAGS